MNDVWTERLKVVKEIVVIIGMIVTAILTALNLNKTDSVQGQVATVQQVQAVNGQKIDDAKVEAERAKLAASQATATLDTVKKTTDQIKTTGDATKRAVDAIP